VPSTRTDAIGRDELLARVAESDAARQGTWRAAEETPLLRGGARRRPERGAAVEAFLAALRSLRSYESSDERTA